MRLTARAWTILVLLLVLWLYGAWHTRHVDSDTGTPRSSAVPAVGEEVGAADTSPRVAAREAAGGVAAAGASPAARASRTAHRRPPIDVTAYCHTGNRTASGVWPREGMAASNTHPFGTRIRVPGWGVVKVTDRIGHSSDLDLYMSTCAKARQWGRQQLRVEVLR